jgi:hypothetical protein
MKELLLQEKFKIIEEATHKQILELDELSRLGIINPEEAENYQQIVIEVLKIQSECCSI